MRTALKKPEPMLKRMPASVFLDLLADGMEMSRPTGTQRCAEPDCNEMVTRGPRCEACRRLRHNGFERARAEREKRLKQSA